MTHLVHSYDLWQELEKKVDFWMEKYEKDVEAKQHELDVLKASKAKDLDKLQELTKLVSTCLLPPKIRKFNTIEKYSLFPSLSFSGIIHFSVNEKPIFHGTYFYFPV